jgi:hypothetical protein
MNHWCPTLLAVFFRENPVELNWNKMNFAKWLGGKLITKSILFLYISNNQLKGSIKIKNVPRKKITKSMPDIQCQLPMV